MRIRIVLEYDGANYSGWQLQVSQNSIQGQLEAALERIFACKIRVHGAGRTDAGVHARGQVAAFAIPREFAAADLMKALNALLPPDIAILAAEPAAPDFDPRRSASSRVYEYRILNHASRSAFEFRYSWLIREPLDLERLNETARDFIGEHDFAAFRSLGSDERSTIRRVITSEWRRAGDVFTYRVEATAFLRHMVRTMVATMVEAGLGRAPTSNVRALLESRDRVNAPASAPPCGLFLMEVRY